MRYKYKIVEFIDGNGLKTFKIYFKRAKGIFSYLWWTNTHRNCSCLKSANDEVGSQLKADRSNEVIKSNEYYHNKIPDHIPNKQIKDYLKMKEK